MTNLGNSWHTLAKVSPIWPKFADLGQMRPMDKFGRALAKCRPLLTNELGKMPCPDWPRLAKTHQDRANSAKLEETKYGNKKGHCHAATERHMSGTVSEA